MNPQTLMLYLIFVLIAASTPGPAVFFAVTNSMLYGWKKAIYAPLGNITGLLCLGIISVSGLGTILMASQLAFTIIKYIGAAYLVYLGIKMISRRTTDMNNLQQKFAIEKASGIKIFIKAFGVAVSNPKAIVFLTALFPQFIDPANHLLAQFSLLITILLFFSFVFLSTYVLLAHQMKNYLTKSKHLKVFNWISGSVFIGFGLLLARSTNK